MQDKYVAYVSTYTMGTLTNDEKSYGIKIYDVDMKNGRFTEKDQVEITNSSYVTISHNKKYLYSITDMGVESYRIEKDGTLTNINHASINGMRGCYLSTDYDDKFLFTAGYHDGKITALRLKEDGGIGAITDEIFCKGMGSVAERNFRPHVSCVKMTRDGGSRDGSCQYIPAGPCDRKAETGGYLKERYRIRPPAYEILSGRQVHVCCP